MCCPARGTSGRPRCQALQTHSRFSALHEEIAFNCLGTKASKDLNFFFFFFFLAAVKH